MLEQVICLGIKGSFERTLLCIFLLCYYTFNGLFIYYVGEGLTVFDSEDDKHFDDTPKTDRQTTKYFAASFDLSVRHFRPPGCSATETYSTARYA